MRLLGIMVVVLGPIYIGVSIVDVDNITVRGYVCAGDFSVT
jgi:hypothetical protein